MGNSDSRKPQASLSLQEKLDQARTQVAKWSQIAALPDLSLPAALFASNAARSYQAAVTLGEKALAYRQESEENLARVAPCSATDRD